MGLIYILTLFCVNILATSTTLDTYIVHVESPDQSHTNEDLDNWYQSFMPTKNHLPIVGKESSHIVHSYHNVFIGFSAKLLPEDMKAMEAKSGFISAMPERILSLQTTHSPEFLGLDRNTGSWNQSNYGKGIIVGLIDSGIALNHPSFGDAGVPPPPAKWKGRCDGNSSACNNKLIGARSFTENGSWPIDNDGHGTHTSSTAAGNFVHSANLFGNANGTAAGIAPLAHVAVYQVCGDDGCPESDVIAGIDAAIDDGVDVISLSVGGDQAMPYYEDKIAIGAYSATKKGIFVSCAAGNSGPRYQTVLNDAPWILTVGASTVDRKIQSTAVLGNSDKLNGQSLYQPRDFPSIQYPLHYPETDPFCTSLYAPAEEFRGKIVVCQDGNEPAEDKSRNIELVGGIGIIFIIDEISGYTFGRLEPTVIPSTSISYADGQKLIKYINSTSSPTSAILFKGTVIGDSHAPQVGSFSARGPSTISPGVLKPDILGPGVGILAAWPESLGLGVGIGGNVPSIWNIITGTSMATPHLSGVAALLKSAHPDWSPAAIKSAIITTADVENLGKMPIEDERQLEASIFAVGSGHVNPSKANNPGLVYDVQPEDYVPFLCGLNYTSKQVGLIVQREVDCSRETSIAQTQLNYPSFAVLFGAGPVQKYSRTVTNVGEADSVYTVNVAAPQYVDVSVNPSTLSFSEVNQKLSYDVTFTVSSSAPNSTYLSQVTGGSLTWSSTKHAVRSPVVAGYL